MFSQRIPLADLADLCRLLHHNLSAGLTIHRVMQQQGERGRRSLRALAARVAARLRNGSSFIDALDSEQHAFPPLFLSMCRVGESTGHLAEVFSELEKYCQLELQLRRQFRSQTFLPIVQFVAAVFIIAGVIFILGLIPPPPGKPPMLTFFGLSGGPGALTFLSTVVGTLLTAATFYYIISSLGRQAAWAHRLLLRVPIVGTCVYAIAMARFTLSLRLTLDSGLPIAQSLELSLEATGNAHFASRADEAVVAVKSGKSLRRTIKATELFADDFLEIVASAEEAGRVPEMMQHQMKYWQEEATRRMTTLTGAAGGAVWLGVAGFIIWAIFRLASVYLAALGG